MEEKTNNEIEKLKQTNSNRTNKTEPHIKNPCAHHKWRYYQAIALNDPKVGPTFFAPLSPYLNDISH